MRALALLIRAAAAFVVLASGALAGPPLEQFPLAETPLAGSNLLAYVASCALPAGVEAVAEDGFRLPGGLGLAPGWRDRPLARDEAHLVSACLLARANAFGAHVEVSLRAAPGVAIPPQSLAASPAERAAFPLDEGAFWGNLFVPGSPAFACRGRASLEAPRTLAAMRRVCTLPSGRTTTDGRAFSACGFILTGPCSAGPIPADAIRVFLAGP